MQKLSLDVPSHLKHAPLVARLAQHKRFFTLSKKSTIPRWVWCEKQMSLRRGMTLLEMLISISITSIIVIVIMQSVLIFYRANNATLNQSFQVNFARSGVESFVRDVREATYADNGAYPIEQISTTILTFFSDIDNDNRVERVQYTLIGNRLTRTVFEPSGTPPSYASSGTTVLVSEYVQNSEMDTPLFRYYDEMGAEITDYEAVGRVRSVAISLIVDTEPERAPEAFTLRSTVTLRNVRNE